MATINKFADALKEIDSEESVSITENGAYGYKNTSSRLVDFFFQMGSARILPASNIIGSFGEAYAEDPARAAELLFLLRDCRGGLGEKRAFETCFDWLVRRQPDVAVKLLPLIPEYGSWKTFFSLTDTFSKSKVVEDAARLMFKDAMMGSMATYGETGKVSSLVAKWAPSGNTSSKDTRRLAEYWRKVLGMSPREYRKCLSKLRSGLRVVEGDMSANRWSEIDYNSVPAKAGLLYRNAFEKHDPDRRRKWLCDLESGVAGAKINTAGLTVAEMVSKYLHGLEEDPTIEAAWRDLVAKGQLGETDIPVLPVVDGSGSMYSVHTGSIRPIDVSIGLGLYLANINTAAWKGMLIEYGTRPSFFKVPVEASLHDQVCIAVMHNDCGSTNVEAVFDLILRTAVRNGFSQKDIPEVVCFSDMEFNQVMIPFEYGTGRNVDEVKLFDHIAKKWGKAGYTLPRLTFWNIDSRTGTIPLTVNRSGVALLAGYSQAIMDMVMSRKLDPLSVLLERLDGKRYDAVRKALAG